MILIPLGRYKNARWRPPEMCKGINWGAAKLHVVFSGFRKKT